MRHEALAALLRTRSAGALSDLVATGHLLPLLNRCERGTTKAFKLYTPYS